MAFSFVRNAQWQKDGLRYPARMRFSYSGEYLFLTLDNRRVERISARSGETMEYLENTVEYVDGPREQTLRIPADGSSYLYRNKEHEMPIPKLTFAVLDVSFGTSGFCITESGGPVRCLHDVNGAERWRYTPPEGSHALSLHYHDQDGFFYGVVWHYETGQFRHLVRFDAETGQASHVRNLNPVATAFCEATEQLVTSDGEVFELSSGELSSELAFSYKT